MSAAPELGSFPSAISSIGSKLAKLVPRLGSNHPGEVIATVEAIRRTLAAVGLDLHDLARAIADHFNPPRRSAKHGARRNPVSDAIHAGCARSSPAPSPARANAISPRACTGTPPASAACLKSSTRLPST
jgi:hypothetical protein